MYTKGEWTLKYNLKHTGKWYLFANDQHLATINQEANAHLIASAPRMHEWIKNIGLHMAVNYDDKNEPFFIIDKDYLAEAHTILAEADGK